MDLVEFGKLVAALRKEMRDEEERPWTQDRLGQETGLGPVIIGNIERGHRAYLDAGALSSLGNALRLTSAERREFFLAALGLDDSQMSRPDSDPQAALDDIMRKMESIRLPAFTVDNFGDFVAVNGAQVRLFEIPPDMLADSYNQVAGFNLMRVLFAPESPVPQLLGRQWAKIATYNISFFRYTTLRYRFTPYFQSILSFLRRYPSFRVFWQQAYFEDQDFSANCEVYRYDHPHYGHIEYLASLATTLTARGQLYLVTYAPATARTADLFNTLIEDGGTTVMRLSPWPDKIAAAQG